MEQNKKMTTVPGAKPVYYDHLRHMLGAGFDRKKKQKGYRNHFCAGIGSKDHGDMLEMEKLGLVTKGSVLNEGRDQYFHATLAGCRAVELHKAGITRALGAGWDKGEIATRAKAARAAAKAGQVSCTPSK